MGYCWLPRRSPEPGAAGGDRLNASNGSAPNSLVTSSIVRPVTDLTGEGEGAPTLGIGIGGNGAVNSAARESRELSSPFGAEDVSTRASARVGATATPCVMTFGNAPSSASATRSAPPL